MEITKLSIKDIDFIVPSYIEYFNNYEEAQWTKQTVERRLKQLFVREDALGLFMKDNGVFIGFAVGQLMQFDDGLVFELNELFIDYKYQCKGYGSTLLKHIEEYAKDSGAFRIQLTTGQDKRHYNFYNTKHNYFDATNNIQKAKQL